MIIVLSKGNKLKKELYHLYLHRTHTWSQVVGIFEKSVEVQAVCIDFRGYSIAQEDLNNIETLRLYKANICLIIDPDFIIEDVLDLSNESYGIDNPIQIEYDDEGLADYLSELIGVDITDKVVRFIEDTKQGEVDLGDLEMQYESATDNEQEVESETEFELDNWGGEDVPFHEIEFEFTDEELNVEPEDEILSDEDLLGDLDEEDILEGIDEIDL